MPLDAALKEAMLAAVPMLPTGVDEFGNPIALDTTGTIGGELPPMEPPPLPTEPSTLTGGYGHETATAPQQDANRYQQSESRHQFNYCSLF